VSGLSTNSSACGLVNDTHGISREPRMLFIALRTYGGSSSMCVAPRDLDMAVLLVLPDSGSGSGVIWPCIPWERFGRQMEMPPLLCRACKLQVLQCLADNSSMLLHMRLHTVSNSSTRPNEKVAPPSYLRKDRPQSKPMDWFIHREPLWCITTAWSDRDDSRDPPPPDVCAHRKDADSVTTVEYCVRSPSHHITAPTYNTQRPHI
jgi:hypothetical protein